MRHLQAAASLEPHDRSLREHIAEVEYNVRARIADDGLAMASIPVLTIGVDEMAKLDLEPSEGFILSRIDGTSSVENIVKISPLAEIDALLVMWELLHGGHLRMK